MQIILLLLALKTFAGTPAGAPFEFENGKYSFECWNSRVDRDEKAALVRESGNGRGLRTVTREGDQVVEHDQWQGIPGEQTIKTRTMNLGDGFYRQTLENKNSVGTEETVKKFEIKLKVIGNNIQFLSTKVNDGPEQEETSEFTWQKMPDGRIVNQGYLRKAHGQYKKADGKVLRVIVSNTLCIYTPTR